LQEGLIRPEQHGQAVDVMNRTGERAEEVLLDLGLVEEADLLKLLALHYRTNFVSTEKLAKAEIPRSTIDLIPARFAESRLIFPVLYDVNSFTLSVVTPDPDQRDNLSQVKIASGARDVRALLARPAAVKAAIARAYQGDVRAFAMLERQQVQFSSRAYEIEFTPGGGPQLVAQPTSTSLPLPAVTPPVPARRFTDRRDPYGPRSDEPQPVLMLDKPKVASVAPQAIPPKAKSAPPSVADSMSSTGTIPIYEEATTQNVKAIVAGDVVVELLNVMVSLLESSRQDLRGHSSHVARLARRLAERMGLAPGSTADLVAAAYLHDLGKMGQFHLTALNVGEYDGHRVAAQKCFSTPARLLEAVRLSPDAIAATEHLYERYDGKGFPDGLSQKEIPLGSRLLAIADTYADLTLNPRNPYRKQLSPQEATSVLAKYKGTLFDPNMVDLLHTTVMGQDVRERLLSNRYDALIIDTDPEETTVVELRMVEQGFEVKTARSAEQAMKILAEGGTDLVLSELDLAQGDGLKLLADARKQPWGKDLPWVIYTRRQERADAQKAFALGVLDFVIKPATTDVLVARLKAMLDQREARGSARGVSGSLHEMGLPDLVQILFHGRKTGSLRIRSGATSGEIHLEDGNVVHALWGAQKGEEAFYGMCRVTDGEFSLDPSFKPKQRTINQSSEALLLEGMRRLDEGIGV
jgi:response regulator RpfG family c-di-GMP phosphodiesterase